MKITIFGLGGTGTTSILKQLKIDIKKVEKIEYKVFSSGNIFREEAKNKNLSVYEFNKIAETDKNIDIELDKKIEKIGKENKNILVDSRLAWYFIKDSIKIKLICNEKIRINRIIERENGDFESTKIKTLTREQSSLIRYKKYYNIENYEEDSHFNLIIDTSNLSLKEISNKILTFILNSNE